MPVSTLATLNSILSTLSSISRTSLPESSSSTSLLPPIARPYLLTLHVLFPHCLLEALDLLDRDCVTRLILSNTSHPPIEEVELSEVPSASIGKGMTIGFAVVSASASRSLTALEKQQYTRAGEGYGTTTNVHRVDLEAWNCTCPGFAFAAYAGPEADPGCLPGAEVQKGRASQNLGFGGLMLTARSAEGAECLPPVCKHILACVLVDKCSAFFDAADGEGGRGVKRKVITVDEAIGWAGGADI